MIQVQIDQDGRIIAMSQDTPLQLGVHVDLPEDFDVLTQRDYRIVDGALVYDPLPLSEPVQTELEKTLARLEADNRLLKAQVAAQTDRNDFLEDVITEIILTVM